MIALRRLTKSAFLFCFFVSFNPEATRAAIVTYSIGNSLVQSLINPYRLEELALSGNQGAWNVDYHYRSNSSLSSFVSQPDLATDFRTAPYRDAFASKHFDAIMLEPFYNATIRQEVDAAKQIINQLRLNPANANTRILIYAVWPSILVTPFASTWNTPDLNLDSSFVPSALSYELFMQQLRIDVPEAEIIPAGHVYDAVLDRVSSPSGLPGLTSVNQLYSDGIHPTNAGSYLAGITTYSVLFGKSPVGLGYTPGYQDAGTYGYVLPSASIPIVQQIALDTITSVPEPSSTAAILVILTLRTISVRTRRKQMRYESANGSI